MIRPFLAVPVIALLAGCLPPQDEFTDGVIMPGPEAQSWGMLDSAILSSDSILNENETTTVVLQFLSAAVSDDEMAAAPALICESGRPTVLNSEVRSPTAAEALADGTLMMIVTCGA